MGAPEGNKYAEGNNGGRPLKFETPEAMEEAIETYYEWVKENPWIKKEAIKSGDMAGTVMDVPTARPFTLIALCHHIGISLDTFSNYEKRQEFLGVTTRARNIIYNNKYEGAAVGAFNANIIARDLGLADKKDVNNSGTVTIAKSEGIELPDNGED